MSDSSITIGQHGSVTVAGSDAMHMMRARTLCSGLKLFNSCGIIPTRGWTAKRMLDAATLYTGQKYKNSKPERERAARDLDTFCNTMRSAIPTIDNRVPK